MVSYVPKRPKVVTLSQECRKKGSIIQYFNATKGAVDTLNEMVGTYRCTRKVLRLPLAIFENMLDISVTVLSVHLQPDWKFNENNYLSHRLFQNEVRKGLTDSDVHYLTQKNTNVPKFEDYILYLNGLKTMCVYVTFDETFDDSIISKVNNVHTFHNIIVYSIKICCVTFHIL